MNTNICDRLDRIYDVVNLRTGETMAVAAPSPLGALYNAHVILSGRIPDENLWTGRSTISLGDLAVENRYVK